MASFSIVARVDVDQTPLSGVRNSGSSPWSSVEAPAEHVINKEKLNLAWAHDCNEERYDLVWDNWQEIIPGTGLIQPRKLSIRVHCFSKSGAFSGGAWAQLTASGDFVKYVK